MMNTGAVQEVVCSPLTIRLVAEAIIICPPSSGVWSQS